MILSIFFAENLKIYRKEAQKCYCESTNCRGWIGGEPESEEELESDDDDDEPDDDESICKDDGKMFDIKTFVKKNSGRIQQNSPFIHYFYSRKWK